MADELLDYYNRELSFIRRLGAEFAEANPKIARRLRLSADDAADDPHVERLIEAFAYLTARVRFKIEDEFPEISGALLGALYPHYLAPIPSMAIAQFQIDPEQVQLTTGHVIPRHTELETDAIPGEPCRFRTCYPVTLWPLLLRSAVMAQVPLPAPQTPYSRDAVAVIRLGLQCPSPDLTIADLAPNTLRFYLKGQPYNIHRLYELLFNHALGVAVTGSEAPVAPLVLDPGVLRQVGFDREESILPYPARSFTGYRLLSEYFAFPSKHLFVDLDLSSIGAMPNLGQQLVVYIYLDRAIPELARAITPDAFQMGCTPIVNLFSQRAEPLALTHREFEYPVVPDRRRTMGLEVYSVDRVVASASGGEGVEVRPFFSVRHARDREGDQAGLMYWHSARRPAEETISRGDRGTEVFLSLVDLNFRPSAPPDSILEVHTTCVNRDLPADLPFGGGQPRLQFREGSGVVTRIVCLTPPTPTLRPGLGHGLHWRLISHLTLNHLSLTDDPKAEALREILTLYNFSNSDEVRSQIAGIIGLASRRVVGPIHGGGPLTFCRGTEITLDFDEGRYSGSGLFLFASVLERFLALYSTLNSFTRLIATVKGRDKELRRWPPRMGEGVMV